MKNSFIKNFLTIMCVIIAIFAVYIILFLPTKLSAGRYAIFVRNWLTHQQIAPERLYISAWRTINNTYFDPTMNHQNWYQWKYRYKNKIKTDEDAILAINTMLASLNDNYSEFFNKEKFYLLETTISSNLNNMYKEAVEKEISKEKDTKTMIEIAKEAIDKSKQNEKNKTEQVLIGAEIPTEQILTKSEPQKPRIEIFKEKNIYAELETIGGIVKYARIIYVPKKYNFLKKNDLIVHIDKHTLFGTDVNYAIQHIRGTKKRVVLYIIRNGKPLKLNIPQGLLNVMQLKTKLLKNDILYISVYSLMNASAVQNIEKIIAYYSNAKGYIIDLRGDTGGLFMNALNLADDFLDKGEILTIQYRNNSKYTFQAQKGKIGGEKPLIILINRKTASSSEILAGALKINNKAYLVGEETFGKNSIQQMIPMANGTCLNLTTAKYLFFEENKSEQKLKPDFYVENSIKNLIKNKDDQLQTAYEIMKQMIKNNPRS